jgi:hypothetical protein
VLINDDSDVEGAETFAVALSNETGGAVLGLVSTAVVTISDDDGVANNPVPVLASIAPTSAVAGSAMFTLTVNGNGFVAGSVVRWNGSTRSTTFASVSQLTAFITAADIVTAGTAAVAVFTPAPGGGTSSGQTFTIAAAPNPLPVLTSTAPTSLPAGSAGFALEVNGSGFGNGSVVRWNGSNRSTTFGSSTRLTASIGAADIASAGTAAVTVFTATPGGGTSGTQIFTVVVSGGGGTLPGLVAAYGFENGSGTVVTDLSGNGNGGTASGTTWTTAGRFGSALTFNGSSSWVSVADSSSLDVTAMTLEAWVYPTVQPAGWRTVIAKEQPGGAIYYLHAGSSSNNQPATGVYASGGEHSLYGGTRLLASTWAHLAATYDGSTQRLYVNGVQISSRAQTGPIAISSGPLRIGGNAVWGEYFQGRIDEVRIYNRALSQAEVQTDMITAITP